MPAWRYDERAQVALGLIGIGALVAALLSLPSPALGKAPRVERMELVSKADARQLFATPRTQWKENVRRAAASGIAVPLWQAGSRSFGMSVRADGGAVSTLLRYDAGEARPTAVMFVMWYDAIDEHTLTDDFAHRIIETVKRQMAPEFHVIGEADRSGDSVAFFFFITQLQPPPRRQATARHGIGGATSAPSPGESSTPRR